MKWNSGDIEKFSGQMDYIDTVIISLYPISFNNDMKSAILITEFIGALTSQLETQLQGRLLLLPGFTYMKSKDHESYVGQLNDLTNELHKQFKHVFFVTADNDWLEFAEDLDGKLIWLPVKNIDQLNNRAKNVLVNEQVDHLLQMLTNYWKTAKS